MKNGNLQKLNFGVGFGSWSRFSDYEVDFDSGFFFIKKKLKTKCAPCNRELDLKPVKKQNQITLVKTGFGDESLQKEESVNTL